MRFVEFLTEEHKQKTQQLDEGFIQDVFNYLWTKSGKIMDKMPILGDKRLEARIKREYEHFVQTMDEQTINEWLDALGQKLKSEHPATVKARDSRFNILRKDIQRVKKSNSSKSFQRNMGKLHTELNKYHKYVLQSNTRLKNNRRAARQAKKDAAMA